MFTIDHTFYTFVGGKWFPNCLTCHCDISPIILFSFSPSDIIHEIKAVITSVMEADEMMEITLWN